METAEKLCAIRERVAGLIGQNPFRTWFGGSTELRLDGTRLEVRVPSAFAGRWITSRYLPYLLDAARGVVGTEPRVIVAVRDAEQSTGACVAVAEPPRPPAVRPLRPDGHGAAPRLERPTLRGELDSFVVGPSNALAFSVIRSFVSGAGGAFKHLVVHGGCGLGKTHLLQGLCNGASRSRPELEWRYLSGEEFTNEFVYALRSGRVDGFRARFRNVDLLVIDDIHFLANKRATQEEFLHTFNAIDACGRMVVLSSDRPPRQLAKMSEPLVNRLIAAMVVEIGPPDLAVRREILRRRAAAMQCELPPEVLDYLAQRITRNVRELEGALYKLVALASLLKTPLDLDLARRTVEDCTAQSRPPQAAEIERGVAAYFGLSVEAIRSRSRDRAVTQARALAMYLIRRHTALSFPEIGRLLGHKQHSTVLMAVRRIQDLVDQDGAVAWKTSSGVRTTPARALLDELEQRLVPGHPD